MSNRLIDIEYIILEYEGLNYIRIFTDEKECYNSIKDGIQAYPYITFSDSIKDELPDKFTIEIMYNNNDNFLYLVIITVDGENIVYRECKRMLKPPYTRKYKEEDLKKLILDIGITCYKDNKKYKI